MKVGSVIERISNEAKSWGEGVDTTGRRLPVPAGHICVLDEVADEYAKCYIVIRNFVIQKDGTTHTVTLVDLAATHARRIHDRS